MTLAGTVLGGAFTSRLNHLIREVRGYTYGIRGDFALVPPVRPVRGQLRGADGGDRAGPGRGGRRDHPYPAGGVTEDELAVARSWRAGQLSVELQSPGRSPRR